MPFVPEVLGRKAFSYFMLKKISGVTLLLLLSLERFEEQNPLHDPVCYNHKANGELQELLLASFREYAQ
jgi:hypothetical protein